MSNVLAKAADSAACSMLNDIGSAGTQLGVWTMWNPKVAMVPLAVGGLSYLANRLLCPQQEFDPGSGPDPNIDGCKKAQEGWGGKICWLDENGEVRSSMQGNTANEIVEVLFERQFNGKWGHQILFTTNEGVPMYFNSEVSTDQEVASRAKYFLWGTGLECQETSSPDDPVPPQPDLDPYDYTDPDTNCNYTVKFEGFAQITPDGEARPVWTISSGAQTTRNSGGVIGGCNLSPTIYVQGGEGGGSGGGGGDGPIPPIPYPPNPPGPDGDGVPWWAKAIAAGATGALLNQIAEGIKDLGKPTFNEGSFTLTAPCDVDENGDPQTRTWEFLEGSFEERMNAHQVALMEIMQQHLNWKTPICGREKPQLEGTWISTRWISDGNSPGGERPLRKLFRYRSKSTLTDEQLRDYWADFSWQAGPVCVRHTGAWWGNPQVWASTPEEGQRVLRFAGAEAGLDPDQVGEWAVGSSRSARYGMSGTMRLESPNGTRWVTRRDGPSSVPA